MAEILPFRGWRYNEKYGREIEHLLSPLFDVVSSFQRQKLYQNPINSIHLSVPNGIAAGDMVQATIKKWKKDQIIVQDSVPGIYVYYQYFRLPGTEKTICRKGFICHTRIYEWDEKVILRHERTIQHSLNDRWDILEKSGFQSSPTFGLYMHDGDDIVGFLDDAISDPIYDVEDYQGVREIMGMIHDAKIINKIIHYIKDKQIILADGHHRYGSALRHKKAEIKKNEKYTGKEGFNYHLIYLCSAEADGVRTLPTHRIIRKCDLSQEEILRKANQYFLPREVNDPQEVEDIIQNKAHVFGLVFQHQAYKLEFLSETHRKDQSLPEELKNMDTSILHHYFIDRVLGIPMEKQLTSPWIEYESNTSKCIAEVNEGRANLALLVGEIPVDQVIKVCKSGYTMPPKSTYFYPKLVSGLVFSSINEFDFAFPYRVFE